ncbi:hypothetical protein NECAME_17652 [Necator americanus]|uniref:Uncharacterized protein n=1 Tax=Necator americanus TaxID=51031 RepID=W2TLV4_NECAM|nr:hypothetical protein NECAME_17652 [Necator americanus]ETN82738.1 hypothetical protein NECAME_17652 [Necator americanus]
MVGSESLPAMPTAPPRKRLAEQRAEKGRMKITWFLHLFRCNSLRRSSEFLFYANDVAKAGYAGEVLHEY